MVQVVRKGEGSMTTLREALARAQQRGTAVGHFNVSDLVAFKAITDTARKLGVPVLVGVSEGEREFVGVRAVSALVRATREDGGLAVFLNADHTHSLEKAEEAARAGFDEVLFDGSASSFEENVAQTRRSWWRARSAGSAPPPRSTRRRRRAWSEG
jgi:fructose-bisphosphate aldolase, class II